MDKFRVNLKNKIDKYIKLNGISYAYFKKNTGSIYNVVEKGSTKFKTLFQASKILDVDIRNLLMFDSYTYVFKNSFETFEEFFVFLGKKLKEIRLSNKLTLVNVSDKININYKTISRHESAKIIMSLDTFYKYLDVLEITPEEFFLKNEIYETKGNDIKNQITIDDFNNRIYELEEIKGRIVGGNIAINPNTFPTLHGFLKICKSLGVSPKDFFNFEKKNFDYDSVVIDLKESIQNIKHILEPKGSKIPRYVKLDTIFLFCNERSIKIADFFDEHCIEGYLSQLFLSIS
ncbi:helix-turn-helix domain-containing protein [Candidatus Arthromitus sp. SFB-turkey]|uniref:helix-turn-helix domain-containing protein n=1 Tax=Candidatus Arthromitus sp. SFB-turkey TaxID=1840217 RepID=UPI0007F41A77|nr:helix-turn-helix transcriptional regulator [Candidatus Arthromitus sp. SFB-turkey]OAT88866.1 hypothetical protein A6P36_05845 [Candidatus Arthromitus sp. SFB-turkey]